MTEHKWMTTVTRAGGGLVPPSDDNWELFSTSPYVMPDDKESGGVLPMVLAVWTRLVPKAGKERGDDR
jgi:hypothetical protein